MAKEFDYLNDFTTDSAIETILNEHPEVRILWERRENIAGEIDINGQNPVLHVLLESIAENQIRLNNPPEARETYERLQKLGLGPHAARGAIANLLVYHMFNVLKHKVVFDTEAYARHLRVLGTDMQHVGRNQPCPCGSGKKFKKCCLPAIDNLKVDKSMGTLVLGGGYYATAGYLLEQPADSKLISMENRGHIAKFMEQQGDLEGTLACLRENVALAEKETEDVLKNALQDLQLFCMNHPEYGDLGLETTERLIELAGIDEYKCQLRCDKADILASMGRLAEAEKEYHALFDDMPGCDHGRYRYALYLCNAGRFDEAKSVLRALLAREGELDDDTRRDAAMLLADMEEES